MFGTSGFILEVLELDSLVRSNFYNRLFYIRRGEEIFFVNKPQGGHKKRRPFLVSFYFYTCIHPSDIYLSATSCGFDLI